MGDSHIACAFSGLTADSKTLIDRARVESQNHWFTYDEKMQVESVAQAVSNLAIAFGNSDDDIGVMSRPFGVAILFAGMDENGPQLFHMDPSGTYLQFAILKQVMEEKLNETNVEAARVTKDGGFHLIKGSELEDIIKELDA